MSIDDSKKATAHELRVLEGLDKKKGKHGKRGINALEEKILSAYSALSKIKWTPITVDKPYVINIKSLKEFLLRNAQAAFPGIPFEDAVKMVKKLRTSQMVEKVLEMNTSAIHRVHDIFTGGAHADKETIRFFCKEMLHLSDKDVHTIVSSSRKYRSEESKTLSPDSLLDLLIEHRELIGKYNHKEPLHLALALYINNPNDRTARLAFALELAEATQTKVPASRLPFVEQPATDELAVKGWKTLTKRRLEAAPRSSKENLIKHYKELTDERILIGRNEITLSNKTEIDAFSTVLRAFKIPMEKRLKLFEKLSISSMIHVLQTLHPSDQVVYRDILHAAIARTEKEPRQDFLTILHHTRLFELQPLEFRDQLSSGNSVAEPRDAIKNPRK